MEKVKGVVYDLDKNSASGADGYTGLFFRHCWDIVGLDVLAATRDILAETPIPKGITSTLIVLIPKKFILLILNNLSQSWFSVLVNSRARAFADDIVIFARGDRRSVGNLVQFLTLYQTGADQWVNNQKSFFVVSKRCSAGHIRRIQQLTNFRHGSFLFTYWDVIYMQGVEKRSSSNF
ncbi:unnamed protein product [Coffea canephora]|uniref:DH200=94 genomic scaffold, scaffold_8928 n=1 Tax=Coffea canephora TaxID=49390 RepID=A0A068VMJ6_COFCA|nr:unnamed protein product [Coffea canephora]